MKKYFCTALALLLAASLFTGCGCTNRNVSNRPDGVITDPTTVNPTPTMTTPTTESTRETTMPTTQSTMPSQGATEPSMTDATVDTGSGSDSGMSGPSGESGETGHTAPQRSRSRSMDRYS
ncbi:MAG: hypothetical protein IJ960_09540 [Oscillospiraceae bacterium]|nr:hypothetical protein [Oscillospiraceae bacterium]